MKFFTRELPQKQYRHEINFNPPEKYFKNPTPGDIWMDNYHDYKIDRVQFEKGDIRIYMTKIRILKPRTNKVYKKISKHLEK